MIYILIKKIASAFLGLACIISLSTMIYSLCLNRNANIAQAEVVSEEIHQYVLKDYNGNLAIFKNNDETPIQEFNILTSTYSEYDRSLLKYGIVVKTKEQLQQLIEDYTS